QLDADARVEHPPATTPPDERADDLREGRGALSVLPACRWLAHDVGADELVAASVGLMLDPGRELGLGERVARHEGHGAIPWRPVSTPGPCTARCRLHRVDPTACS